MNALLTNPLPVILALIIGVLIGVLAVLVFRSEPKPPVEAEPMPKKFAEKGYTEAMRVYFSPAEKKVLPRLDGDYYDEFSSLTLEQKARVQRLVDALSDWSGRSPAKTPPVLPAAESPRPIERPAAAPVAPAVAASSLTAFTAPAQLDAAEPAAAKKEPQTIVEQINDLVEKMASNLSERERSVHLTDNGHQGVTVWVGLEKFNSVDDVPYPEVQGLIKAAVARWEADAVQQPKEE